MLGKTDFQTILKLLDVSFNRLILWKDKNLMLEKQIFNENNPLSKNPKHVDWTSLGSIPVEGFWLRKHLFHVHCLSEPNWFSQVYRFTLQTLQNGVYEGRRGDGVGGGEEEVLLTPEFFIQASLFVMFLLPFNNEDLLVQQTSTTGQKGQYSHI